VLAAPETWHATGLSNPAHPSDAPDRNVTEARCPWRSGNACGTVCRDGQPA